MLLTKTTELAIQVLVSMATTAGQEVVRPRQLAERLHESPSYMAKVLQILSQQGLLKSYRGKAGGYALAKAPSDISLLEVVEICQGSIAANYCKPLTKAQLARSCGYHRAMHELQQAVKKSLGRWTIARISAIRSTMPKSSPACVLSGLPR